MTPPPKRSSKRLRKLTAFFRILSNVAVTTGLDMQAFQQAPAPEVGEHRDLVGSRTSWVTCSASEMFSAVRAQDLDVVRLNVGQIFVTIWRSLLKRLRTA